jgi:hypothetical protein
MPKARRIPPKPIFACRARQEHIDIFDHVLAQAQAQMPYGRVEVGEVFGWFVEAGRDALASGKLLPGVQATPPQIKERQT